MILFIIGILVALGAVVISVMIIIPHLLGAPFMRTHARAREIMYEFADIQPSDIVVDLGSGDGVLVIGAAQRGAYVVGYEINPLLVFLSRRKVKKLKLPHVQILLKSFWQSDLSDVDVVLLFGIPHIMKQLEQKLIKELPLGARVISFTFQFPSWEPIQEKENVRLYIVN